MTTQVTLEKKLKEYKKRFLTKKLEDLDEASTRIMINYFLTDICGYVEFEDIKTEYRIADTYADYVIQINKKKHFVIEVKSMQLDLSEKHLRQALNYAINEGIDWVLLTNGSVFVLYKVLFGKPVSSKKVFEHNIAKEKNLKDASKDIYLLTKKSIKKKELEKYWERFEVIEPIGLSKLLYNKVIVTAIRKVMRQKVGLIFSEEEVLDALHEVIRQAIETTKPTKPTELRIKKPKDQKKTDSPADDS